MTNAPAWPKPEAERGRGGSGIAGGIPWPSNKARTASSSGFSWQSRHTANHRRHSRCCAAQSNHNLPSIGGPHSSTAAPGAVLQAGRSRRIQALPAATI
jgi:hypothetical protein